MSKLKNFSHSRTPSPHSQSRPSIGDKDLHIHLDSDNDKDSNLWLIGFALAVIAILFSQEISDFIHANDETRILKHYSSQLTPNISAWTVVPIPSRGGGYGVIATRDILPGELIIKEAALVKIKVSPTTVDKANRQVQAAIQDLSGEDRNRFLSLSNAWGNQSDNGTRLNKYSGILQTNGIRTGRSHISIFPSISRINHACTGAVNAVYNWRESEGRQVVHVTKPIRSGEEIFVSYFDSKLPKIERQAFLRNSYSFNCSCSVCALGQSDSLASDARITKINSLKATLSAWSAGSIGGAEAVKLVEDAVELMRQEGMTYEFGQLYADAAHIATAHSDFRNARRFATLAAKHFTIELGPDSVQVAVANKVSKNPTASSVWATRPQETVAST